MGGDDLGSDDEYLVGTAADEGQVPADDSASDNETPLKEEGVKQQESSNKRSLSPRTTPDKEEVVPETTKKKRKRRHKDNPLAELGHTVRTLSDGEQAKLLTDFAGIAFGANQVRTCDETSNLPDRIQGLISRRKMKRWKEKQSPCVLIVCLSARRAVQMLKELAPFNIRAAKLFAKHMSIDTQKELLEDGAFGIAVGTPHRILALLQEKALTLKSTKLVVLDTFQNQKGFSVYTLPDTMTATKDLLQDHVHNNSHKKKGVRVGFV